MWFIKFHMITVVSWLLAATNVTNQQYVFKVSDLYDKKTPVITVTVSWHPELCQTSSTHHPPSPPSSSLVLSLNDRQESPCYTVIASAQFTLQYVTRVLRVYRLQWLHLSSNTHICQTCSSLSCFTQGFVAVWESGESPETFNFESSKT